MTGYLYVYLSPPGESYILDFNMLQFVLCRHGDFITYVCAIKSVSVDIPFDWYLDCLCLIIEFMLGQHILKILLKCLLISTCLAINSLCTTFKV